MFTHWYNVNNELNQNYTKKLENQQHNVFDFILNTCIFLNGLFFRNFLFPPTSIGLATIPAYENCDVFTNMVIPLFATVYHTFSFEIEYVGEP